MKKGISLILILLMLLCIPVPATAGTGTELVCNASETQLDPCDELTITVELKNAPKAKSIALVFDYDATKVFSLVGGEWVLTGGLLSNFDNKTTVCGTAAIAYVTSTDVNGSIFRLKLKAKETAPAGQSVIKVTPVIKNDASVIECSEASIGITIKGGSTDCTHNSKSLVEAKPSTTTTQGWDAYYVCDNCGQLFADDGVTKIDEIPYRPLITVTDNAILTCSASSQSLKHDDEVTITVALDNASKAKSVALVFNYNTAVFTPVSGEWLLNGAMLSNFDSKTTACGTAAIAYATETSINGDIFTLKLKVKDTATVGKATFDVSAVIKNDAKTIPCDAASLEFTINSEDCQHNHKTSVPKKESECDEHGWAAYYTCDDCGQLFAEDGVTEIDEVPYYPFRPHSGGEATCKYLAVCDHCGKPYGSLDPHNHKGETEIRNKVEAGCTVPGYSGDIYCCDCGVKLSSGSVIKATGHVFLDDNEYCLNGCGTKNPTYHLAKGILGDADNDGEITITDATMIQRYLADMSVISFREDLANVDGDDSITITDATYIQRFLSDMLIPYPVGDPVT